jgi:NADH:ubiquinone oxidoreductase subunit F (NADH-binding)
MPSLSVTAISISPALALTLFFGVQGKIMGNTICALGDAAAMPVESFFIYRINVRKR